MPVYPFVCRECKKEFEIVSRIEKFRPKAVKCPKCGSKKVERVWSHIYVETSKKS